MSHDHHDEELGLRTTNTMSSEKFETLDDDFTSLLDSLRERIERKIPYYNGGEEESKNHVFCNLIH